MNLRSSTACSLFAACAIGAASALAQTWPQKPIHVIVPYTAGGTTDIMARVLQPRLGASIGQAIIVENRPGGNGVIGAEIVARAAPDGYTLMLTTSATNTMLQFTAKSLPYDPVKDFTPIAATGRSRGYIIAHPSMPFGNFRELLEYAKKNPGKLSFASSTAGSPGHLAGELLRIVSGGLIEHIPYKGGAPAIADMLAGRVQIMFEGMNSMAPHVKGGRLRGIAVTAEKRIAAFPDLPTMAESGLQGFDISAWQGMVAPAGIARPLLDRINAAVNRAVATPNFKNRMAEMGSEATGGTPEAFAALIKRDSDRWGEVIRKAGIKAN